MLGIQIDNPNLKLGTQGVFWKIQVASDNDDDDEEYISCDINLQGYPGTTQKRPCICMMAQPYYIKKGETLCLKKFAECKVRELIAKRY